MILKKIYLKYCKKKIRKYMKLFMNYENITK